MQGGRQWVVLDQRDFCAHDTAGFDADRVVLGNTGGDVLHKVDAQLDVGLLEGLVSLAEGGVDLRLDIPRLVDQIHQLPDQDVPLFVHQHIALLCQGQRVLGQNQVTLCRECIRIHEKPSYSLSAPVSAGL